MTTESPDLTNTVFTTNYGEATLPELLKAFEMSQRQKEAKKAWLQTDEGKEYNRIKAKEYYKRHKDVVLEKRKERYEKDAPLLNERSMTYYTNNKEKILNRLKEKRKTPAVEA
jgi:hypothetical protein